MPNSLVLLGIFYLYYGLIFPSINVAVVALAPFGCGF